MIDEFEFFGRCVNLFAVNTEFVVGEVDNELIKLNFFYGTLR